MSKDWRAQIQDFVAALWSIGLRGRADCGAAALRADNCDDQQGSKERKPEQEAESSGLENVVACHEKLIKQPSGREAGEPGPRGALNAFDPI
jgi:hypothetical protein